MLCDILWTSLCVIVFFFNFICIICILFYQRNTVLLKKEQKIATNSNFLISEPSKFDIDFRQFVRLDCQV